GSPLTACPPPPSLHEVCHDTFPFSVPPPHGAATRSVYGPPAGAGGRSAGARHPGPRAPGCTSGAPTDARTHARHGPLAGLDPTPGAAHGRGGRGPLARAEPGGPRGGGAGARHAHAPCTQDARGDPESGVAPATSPDVGAPRTDADTCDAEWSGS